MPYFNSNIIIQKLHEKLSTHRAGRVSSSVLDQITVYIPAYESNMKIVELATINIPDSNQITISPFDKNHLTLIEQAISKSNLGVNPVNDGIIVRLVFPPLTEERRLAMSKEVGKEEESFRIEIRQIRQDTINGWKKLEESGEITKEELEDKKIELQKEIDKANKEIEAVIKQKQEDLMKL